MRATVLSAGRSVLISFLAVGLLNFPAMAASEKPLGMVTTAAHARLANADAVIGANIYPDDSLVTDEGGSLRMRVGASQIYLLSLSSASLEPADNKVQARVDRGTLGFSTSIPGQLEVQTPAGVIRGADAKPIFGQVSILSPTKMTISSYQGTLVLAAVDGTEKTIPPGETYEATLAYDPPADSKPPAKGVTGPKITFNRILELAIPPLVAGIVICSVWPESDSAHFVDTRAGEVFVPAHVSEGCW